MKNVEVVVIISSGMDLKIPTDIAVLVVEIWKATGGTITVQNDAIDEGEREKRLKIVGAVPIGNKESTVSVSYLSRTKLLQSDFQTNRDVMCKDDRTGAIGIEAAESRKTLPGKMNTKTNRKMLIHITCKTKRTGNNDQVVHRKWIGKLVR